MDPDVLYSVLNIFHHAWLIHLLVSLVISQMWKKYIYVATLCWGTTFGSWVVFDGCPLTMIEQSILKQTNPEFSYKGGSFVVDLLAKVGIPFTPEAVRIAGMLIFLFLVIFCVVHFLNMCFNSKFKDVEDIE